MTSGRDPGACGCCEGIHDAVPAAVFNRPGLTEIGYRVGTYAQLRASMLAGLTRSGDAEDGGRPALASLRTRDQDDFSISLIDAWAVAGDVLSFYIERTANEHYLGTATERGSVAGLVHLIGYRLKPGVAAETHLAFTLETGPGTPGSTPRTPPPGVPAVVPIVAGTQVQSIPGPGESPQTFETVEGITALTAWNRLTVTPTTPRPLVEGDRSALLAGNAFNVRPGDALLFVASDGARFDLQRVVAVEAVPADGTVRLTWAGSLSNNVAAFAPADAVAIHVMHQRASLFGYNAPDPQLFSPDVRTTLGDSLTSDDSEWAFAEVTESVSLDALYRGIEPDSWSVFVNAASEGLYRIEDVSEISMSAYATSARVSLLTLDSTAKGYGAAKTRGTTVLLGSERLPQAEWPITQPLAGDRIEVTDDLDALEAPRTILIRGRAPRMAAPDTGLELRAPDGATRTLDAGTRLTVLRLETEVVGFPGQVRWTFEAPDGTVGTWMQKAGALGPSDAESDDPVIGEVATVTAVDRSNGRCVLVLGAPLARAYDRPTGIEIYGNVARGTHGETVREVLGNGDASRPDQRFTLRRGPLTHTRGASQADGGSTLEVWVNDVRWREERSLFGLGARDRRYVTRIDDDGATVVQAGDGVAGSRFATGQENVRAVYRVGTGRAGMVKRDQLNLLLTKPLGVKAVTNPLPPTGGQDAQDGADARINAPRSVGTMGRIVSLTDHADFARDFPGVAKASAVWTWDGARRGVLVTIAGIDGATVAAGDPLMTDLVAAMASAGDTRVALRVVTYRPRRFTIGAELVLDGEIDAAVALRGVKGALAGAYRFAAREFGMPVSLSEVMSVIHAQRGVSAVEVTALHLAGEGAGRDDHLVAEAPRPGGPPSQLGAELLTLDPASLDHVEVRP